MTGAAQIPLRLRAPPGEEANTRAPRASKRPRYTTLVTATIENLNILDVVTADRVVSRISSYHVGGAPESHFSFLGSKFENLHIGGCKADITLNHDFFAKYKTFAAVRNELERKGEFRRMTEDPFQTGNPIQMEDGHEVILCSLVKKMATDAPDVTTQAHAFVIPHFGRVYLAEAKVYAQAVMRHLRETPGIGQLEVAGSFRRCKETVGDLDLLVTCKRSGPVMDRLAEYQGRFQRL